MKNLGNKKKEVVNTPKSIVKEFNFDFDNIQNL